MQKAQAQFHASNIWDLENSDSTARMLATTI
ncbi:hypothetical protein NC652_018555 [Populus alba x Populus x berolinensis]|nr:hypothetical protein NC652_018555 [Populus alba x Populus x berolinensis]